MCLTAVVTAATLIAAPAGAERVEPSYRVRSKVTVRRQPKAHSPVAGSLWTGESAELLSQDRRWYRIVLDNGESGYVPKAWTRIVGKLVPFAVHFIDVAEGDATIIDIGEQEIVIDGGNSARVLHDYAETTGIIDGPIELVVITHSDQDHWKGLRRLLGYDSRGNSPHDALEVWEPGFDRACKKNSAYTSFIAALSRDRKLKLRRPLEATHSPATTTGKPEPFSLPTLPGVTFTLLHSDATPDGPDCAAKIDNSSIVLKITIGDKSLLFAGDARGSDDHETTDVASSQIEAALLAINNAHPNTLRADLLKVPNHGSDTSNTLPFVDAIAPRWAVVLADAEKGGPPWSVVARYTTGWRKVLRTDRNLDPEIDHIYCQQTTTSDLSCSYVYTPGDGEETDTEQSEP